MLLDKFEAVRVLLNEHNEAVGGAESLGYIDTETFLNKVKQAGGTSDDRLKGFSHEGILDLLGLSAPKNDVKPLAIAKDIAKIFRGKEEESSTNSPKPVSAKKADKMSLSELVQNFDPEDFTSSVALRLKQIVRNEPFIVFSEGRIVAVEKTLELLAEVKKGFEGRKTVVLNGSPVKVFKIGELPDDLVDENPLYPGRPLRPDGTCDQLNRSWQGVPKEVKQFVRIALEGNLINVTSDGGLDRAHTILDTCLNNNALGLLRTRYHAVAVEFDKRQKLGTLPPLFVTLANSNSKNPFEGGKQVAWIAPVAKRNDPWLCSNNYLAIPKDQWKKFNQ